MTAPLVPGALIAGRFRLERPLGTGGMGTVWAATNAATRKEVALKFLKPALSGSAGAAARASRQRLLREARATCAAAHPHIAAVHDVLELVDGSPVLVMELLRGESLRARLKQRGALPVEEATRILRQVLSALAAAHSVGVVHRDLKPDNIFLVDSADGRTDVRVLDFGVAKLTASEGGREESAELTSTGAMLGTPFYMAPEQAFGEKDVDARADLWAVGIVLYECLAGERPTHGDNLGQILKSITAEAFPPLEKRVPGVSAAMGELVRSLLARDREERPASAREVERLLERIETGRATRPGRAAFLGVSVFAILCAVGVAAWRSPKNASPLIQARPEPSATGAEQPFVPVQASSPAIPTAPAIAATSPSILPVARRADSRPATQSPPSATTPADGLEGPGKILVKPPF